MAKKLEIAKILKQALRKSAEEFIFEGSWCDKYVKQLKENPLPPQPSIITEQLSCDPNQSRQANDWSSPGINNCAAGGKAIRCSNIDPAYNGTLANVCAQNGGCQNYSAKIKLFPPNIPMTNNNQCEDGLTAVPGDYMLSHTGGNAPWVPWLIVESNAFNDYCSGPRIGHTVCSWAEAGCQDQSAVNYSPTFNDPCDQDPTYPANCIGGATGPDCCCTYPGPGCTDPIANNYVPYASSDDGSCEYEGCIDPTAQNYSFPNSSPQVTADGDPYDGDPSTGNGGFAIDDGSCIAVVEGCVDCPNCSNYNSNPGITDDGSCLGCINSNASNYEPNADVDDGSCVYDESFSCVQGLCEDPGDGSGPHASLSDCLVSQECDRWECKTIQEPDPLEEQLGVDVLDRDRGPREDMPTTTDCFPCDESQYDEVNQTWDPNCIHLDEVSCTENCNPPGCTDPVALNYDPNAITDDGSCEYESCDTADFANYSGPNSGQVIDAYDMGLINNQANGVLDGNSDFCLEVCRGGNTLLGFNNQVDLCDCCGDVHDCETLTIDNPNGAHGNEGFGCWACDAHGTQGGPGSTTSCDMLSSGASTTYFASNPTGNLYNTEAACVAQAGQDCYVPPIPSCKTNPAFCETNPFLTPGGACWICHMMTECMPVYDYLQYGSGPPGSVGTMTFMMNWLIKDSSGIYTTTQGSNLYCTEQQCMQQTGCTAYSGYSPIPKKADPSGEIEPAGDDLDKNIDQIMKDVLPPEEENLKEGVNIKGKILNSNRMQKLAGIINKKRN